MFSVAQFVVPVEAVILTVWWLVQSWRAAPERWLDPIAVDNVGTVLFQFAVVLIGLLILNRFLATRTSVPGDTT